MPGLEHCKSTVTRWKISRRKIMQAMRPGRKYRRGFLGRLVRFTFKGASSSSGHRQKGGRSLAHDGAASGHPFLYSPNLPFVPGSQAAPKLAA